MRLVDADSLKEKLCILGEHRIERLVEIETTVDVLEQIRAEINVIEEGISSYHNDRPWVFKDEVLQIIDKYK